MALLFAVPCSQPALAWAPTCGGTVPPGTWTPGANAYVPCASSTNGCVLTMSTASTLNMNGLIIQCTGAGLTGICITGANAHLKGQGQVLNCAVGVSTAGQNEIVSGIAVVKNDIGLLELPTASGNSFTKNTVLENSSVGIEAQGGSIKISKNGVYGNGVGIELEGTANFADGNSVLGNTLTGILGNGTTSSGIRRNMVQANNFGQSTGAGIELMSTAHMNTVTKNTAQGNFNTSTGSGFLDLLDDSVGCDSNSWGPDTFGFNMPSCAD
jgi:hypothetical protein